MNAPLTEADKMREIYAKQNGLPYSEPAPSVEPKQNSFAEPSAVESVIAAVNPPVANVSASVAVPLIPLESDE